MDMGVVEARNVTSSYKRMDDFCLALKIIKSQEFILEAVIILLDPACLSKFLDGEQIIEMDTVNWNEQVGDFKPH